MRALFAIALLLAGAASAEDDLMCRGIPTNPTFTSASAATGNFAFVDAGVATVHTQLRVGDSATAADLLLGNPANGTRISTTGASMLLNAGPAYQIVFNAGTGAFSVPENFLVAATKKYCLNASCTVWVTTDGSNNMVFALANATYMTINSASGAVIPVAGGISASAAASWLGLSNKAAINTAPTVVACSGTAASVAFSNGTAMFEFDVGTSCAGESTATITLPAATNGWLCHCDNQTTADRMLQNLSGTTTTAVVSHFVRTTGAAQDFADGANIRCMCMGG